MLQCSVSHGYTQLSSVNKVFANGCQFQLRIQSNHVRANIFYLHKCAERNCCSCKRTGSGKAFGAGECLGVQTVPAAGYSLSLLDGSVTVCRERGEGWAASWGWEQSSWAVIPTLGIVALVYSTAVLENTCYPVQKQTEPLLVSTPNNEARDPQSSNVEIFPSPYSKYLDFFTVCWPTLSQKTELPSLSSPAASSKKHRCWGILIRGRRHNSV